MTDGRHIRDSILDALRRDLVGPIFDPTGSYPGSKPKLVKRGTAFTHRSDANGTFVADDGEEVVTYSPTARYGVGIIYPSMSREAEEQLDLEQLHEAETQDLDSNFPSPNSPASSMTDALVDVPLEPDEAPANHYRRPSSVAISFVLKLGVTINVSIVGASYEPFFISIAGNTERWWHRVPLPDTSFEITLPLSTERCMLSERLVEVGSLRLLVSGFAHRMQSGDNNRIVTCFVRNISKPTDPILLPSQSLFQSQLRVSVPPEGLLDYRQHRTGVGLADDEESFRLLYAHSTVKAVGHGCDASFILDNESGRAIVSTESLPVVQLPVTSVDVTDIYGKPIEIGMFSLGQWSEEALSGVDRLIVSYKTWISSQERAVDEIPMDLKTTAQLHLQRCRNFLEDIKEGWNLANSDRGVRQCLQWTSQAMAEQQLVYRAETRQIKIKDNAVVGVDGIEPRSDGGKPPIWRPFQIAFLLANLSASVNKLHSNHRNVDVIWMPTGGGKTEAYLALAAFTMLWRRLKSNGAAVGTSVIMRYTLRMLTAQQTQRAASLICALEVIRTKHVDLLGKERFAIGAWLGAASTPNRRSDAITQLNNYRNGNGKRPFLLTRCPWCATDMTNVRAFGYRRQQLVGGGSRVQASCPNPGCDYNIEKAQAGLPVYEVDEDLYERPPTFLLGTVDKFAMLAWQERTRAFFGLNELGDRKHPAPDLIIQDELHLISGPLGSLVGLYEGAIANLCEHDGGTIPRVVAATATTKAYERQVKLLFNASGARLVPPVGLSIEDSYFAHADDSTPPRTFVGVCAPGLGSFTHTEARVLASLSHVVGALENIASQSLDYYWTNLVFFGSLRDLGLTKSLVSTDLQTFQYSLSRATGVRSGKLRDDGTRSAVRYLNDAELTSASSQSASDALTRLQLPGKQQASVDLALATSVIEVGVDVPRLGLLTIVRQPKTAATYIQVSGRVGRTTKEGPGLIVVLLDPWRSRDISHYERFTPYHKHLFASVEASSITPFTDAILERGLRGAISAIVRQKRRIGSLGIDATDIEIAKTAADYLRRRSQFLDPQSHLFDEWMIALAELRQASAAMIKWGDAGPARESQFLRRPETPSPTDTPSWAAPTSLRSVDNQGGLRTDIKWLPPERSSNSGSATKEIEDEW